MLDCKIARAKWLLRNEIGSISDKIHRTIFAESNGALTWGGQFSFGNGGREDTGYVTMFPVRILGMGLSSARKTDNVTGALLWIMARFQNEGFLSLTIDKESMTLFYIPFEVTEGSVINFVSKANSSDTLCITVSLIMEIIKQIYLYPVLKY